MRLYSVRPIPRCNNPLNSFNNLSLPSASPPFPRAGQRLLANKSSGASAGTIPSGQDLVASMEAADRDRRREERLVPDAGSGDESDD